MLFNKNLRKSRRYRHECRKCTSKNPSLIVSEERVNAKTKMRRDVGSQVDNHKGLLVVSCSQLSISVLRTEHSTRLRRMAPSYHRNCPAALRSAKLKKTCISGTSSIRRTRKRKRFTYFADEVDQKGDDKGSVDTREAGRTEDGRDSGCNRTRAYRHEIGGPELSSIIAFPCKIVFPTGRRQS